MRYILLLLLATPLLAQEPPKRPPLRPELPEAAVREESAKGRLATYNGYFYRETPAGDWAWCEECNGFPWRPGLQPRGKMQATGVPAPAPFGTPATTVHGVAGVSTWSLGAVPFPGRTFTGAAVGLRGFTDGCASPGG